MADVTITEFLLARIAEDEAAAWGACRSRPDLGADGTLDHWEPGVGMRSEVMGPMESVAGAKNPAAALHIARHDPARVLAECEAKDRMLGRLMDFLGPVPPGGETEDQQFLRHFAGSLVKEMTLPHADHPDYREEWRP